MKRALVAASVALFLVDACGVAAALPADQIFERVAPSIWSVHAFGADGKPLASGNGLSVAPGRLVTSCRTLARARRVELRQGGKVYGAQLEFPDVERDLCQLHVPGLNAPVLAQVSARTLRPGQRVYVIGFSFGNEASIAEGLVSAVRDAGGPNERVQTTVPAAGGLNLTLAARSATLAVVPLGTATPPVATRFFTVSPCRVLDTRSPASGPALAASTERAVTVGGSCGVPPTAKAVSANLTVTQPTTAGNLALFPTGSAPSTSTLNYTAGQTRGNNAVVSLSSTAALSIRCNQAGGSAHVILDVNGYFQ